MTCCVACCNALKITPRARKQIDEKEFARIGLILDSIESNREKKPCVKAHVQTVRSLLKDAFAASTALNVQKSAEKCGGRERGEGGEATLRSVHCNQCRVLLKKHIAELWEQKIDEEKKDVVEKPQEFGEKARFLSFAGLKTLVDWSCEQGEALRLNDPKQFDDVLAAFAWCAREEIEIKMCDNVEKSQELQKQQQKLAKMF